MPATGVARAQEIVGTEKRRLIIAECTDPLTTIDIPNLLRQTGDRLEEKSEADGVLTFRIRKS
jgi:tRNA 2-thiouridine synthesizing protein A